MNAPCFEYRTEYVEIPFKTKTARTLFIKSEEPTLDPDIPALVQAPAYTERLNELGAAGWELVTVQTASRGERLIGNQNAQGWAYGFSIPIGYVMFFKRQIQSISH